MKAMLKRMLRPFYRGAKKILRPVAERVRGPLSRLLYPPEFEAVFRNLEQITGNLKGYIDQSDQMLLAMFQTLHLPPAPNPGSPAFAPVALGNGRILAKHPAALHLFVDANDLHDTPRILLNQYEPNVTEALRRIVRLGDCCVDLGAGIGYHTLTMAIAAGASARGFALECDSHKATLLRDNLISADLAESCKPCPVGDEASSAHALEWFRDQLGSRSPDVVRIDKDFDMNDVLPNLLNWSQIGGTRFLLSSVNGTAIAGELRGCVFWIVSSDGSLHRVPLDEIEQRGRQAEVHFLAARELV